MVKESVQNPEKEGTGYRRRRLAFRSYRGDNLKVVYTVERDEIVIITVIWE